MGEFWDWMFEKNYGFRGQFGHKFLRAINEIYEEQEITICPPTKQMLIGYMWEYLADTSETEWKYFSVSRIEDMYDFLKRSIEDKEEKIR